METKINSKALKAEALRLGFSACGIAPAEPIDQAHQNALKMWLDADRASRNDLYGESFRQTLRPGFAGRRHSCVDFRSTKLLPRHPYT